MDAPSNSLIPNKLNIQAIRAVYIAAFLVLAFKTYDYYHPNFGYTVLPQFGAYNHEQSTELLKSTPHYTLRDSHGYDGQYYAQLALEPTATGEEIENALDNHTYRARRILFSWTAYALGMGDPYWSLQAYSIQNALFWFLTGLLLLRWLPPNCWQNAIRFIACFFTAGLVYSFNYALLDGPSLFLILAGAALIESKRPWLGSCVLGLAGLGKETNLLAIAALWKPAATKSKQTLVFCLQALIATLPFALWHGYLLSTSNASNLDPLGNGNFHLPLVGWFTSALQILKAAGEYGFSSEMLVQYILLATFLAQGIYLIARPKPNRVWWRIGVIFAILMLILGPAVWEGLKAVPRVVLPLTIAFNLLFSRKRIFLPILIALNSATFVGISSLHIPIAAERFEIVGRSDLAFDSEKGSYSNIKLGEGWYRMVGGPDLYRIWSSGDSVLTYRNPGDLPIRASIHFYTKTISARTLILELNGNQAWQTSLPVSYSAPYSIPITLVPGENTLRLHSPEPTDRAPDDLRELSFQLFNYKMELIEQVSDNP